MPVTTDSRRSKSNDLNSAEERPETSLRNVLAKSENNKNSEVRVSRGYFLFGGICMMMFRAVMYVSKSKMEDFVENMVAEVKHKETVLQLCRKQGIERFDVIKQ